MNAFRAHGSYLFDHRQTGIHRLCWIPEDTAFELLRESKYVVALDAESANCALVNKTFAIVKTEGDQVVVVYNHDGNYSLCLGPKGPFLAAVNLTEL